VLSLTGLCVDVIVVVAGTGNDDVIDTRVDRRVVVGDVSSLVVGLAEQPSVWTYGELVA